MIDFDILDLSRFTEKGDLCTTEELLLF